MSRKENLIWIDLEMTGLEPDRDRIIEIATVVTDKELTVLAEGPVIAIYQSDDVLRGMDEWNTRQHASSGLTERVRNSTASEAEAEQATLLHFPLTAWLGAIFGVGALLVSAAISFATSVSTRIAVIEGVAVALLLVIAHLAWLQIFRVLQAREAWLAHGSWIQRSTPNFAPDIARNFDFASKVKAAEVEEAGQGRLAIARRMAMLLENGAVMCLPAAPSPPPLSEAADSELGELRPRILSLKIGRAHV